MKNQPQIIVIPQNMLSKQSINILKQRQVLPNHQKMILPTLQQKPLATVIGNQRQFVAVQPHLVMPSPPTSPPLLIKRSISREMDIDIKEEDEEDDENYQPARKRTNLDHMSSEEKLNRRKLKNRVAAQNARDKKKAYMDDLEIHLNDVRDQKQQVEEERNRLKVENQRLSLHNSRLSQENTTLLERNLALEKRLGLDIKDNYILPFSPASIPRTPSPTGSLVSCPDYSKGGHSIFMEDSEPEPAVLSPLPQESRVLSIKPETPTKMTSSSLLQTQPSACTALSSHDLTTLSPNCVEKRVKKSSPTLVSWPQLLLIWATSLMLPRLPPPLITTSPLKSPSTQKKNQSSNFSRELTCSETQPPPLMRQTLPGKPPPLTKTPSLKTGLVVPLKKRNWRSPLPVMSLLEVE